MDLIVIYVFVHIGKMATRAVCGAIYLTHELICPVLGVVEDLGDALVVFVGLLLDDTLLFL
jgi:hypothetical protein